MNKNELAADARMKKIITRLTRHKVKKIGIFGSFARGEAKPRSDIDIIVEFSEKKSLLDLVRIEQELSKAVGKKVDLLTEQSISPYLIKRIKKELIVIYG